MHIIMLNRFFSQFVAYIDLNQAQIWFELWNKKKNEILAQKMDVFVIFNLFKCTYDKSEKCLTLNSR